MTRGSSLFLASASAVLAACGGAGFSFPTEGTATPVTTASGSDAAVTSAPGSVVDAGSSADATVPPTDDAGAPSDDAATSPSPDAAQWMSPTTPDAGTLLSGLQTITANCTVASNGSYATDRSATAAVDICKLNGAFFWTADLAIDCDGQKTTECNSTTDSTFSAETSVTQSNGQPLIASELPYVVVPLPGTRFDYTKEGILPGALAIVIYGNQVMYGILGDEGPTGVIGEASYAMAQSFGMNTNPNSGGTSGQVTYIVLTGTSAVVSPVENHTAAVTLASTLVPALIANN